MKSGPVYNDIALAVFEALGRVEWGTWGDRHGEHNVRQRIRY